MNPEALDGWPRPGIIAVPNCTTIAAVLAVGPLHRAAGLRSLVLSSYQAVSGAGQKGTRELAEQIEKLGGQVEALARPDRDALPAGDVFARPIAFNVVPQIGEFEPDGFTGEEVKMMAEPEKILSAPSTWRCSPPACACRSSPGTRSRSSRPSSARSTWPRRARCSIEARGVTLLDDPSGGPVPHAAGRGGAG